ncbi:capsule polysaccharide biosynthesis family protein [Synechococcus sp. NOUM97013]|nr:capsule polysaccharide biosynthesis family protein [Synechococcus sp. NOUM97013]
MHKKDLKVFLYVNDETSFKFAQNINSIAKINIIETSPEFLPQCKDKFKDAYVFTQSEILDCSYIHLKSLVSRFSSCHVSLDDAQAFIKSHYLIMTHLYSRTVELSTRPIADKDVYFLGIFNFCSALLNAYPINLVIFLNEPHQIHDFIIQQIAAQKNAICIDILKTFIPKWVVMRDPIRDLMICNSSRDSINISSQLIRASIESKCTASQMYDPRTKFRLSNARAYPLKSFPIYIIKSFLMELPLARKSLRIGFAALISCLREKNMPHYCSTLITCFYHRLYRFIARVQSAFLYKKQCANNISINFHEPGSYVFLPLQCSPERQSMPSGMPCFSQANLIEEVSYQASLFSLDLVVKEHPSQHKLYQRNYLGRTSAFFDLNNSLNNSIFYPSYVDSYKLIDNASAVIGIGGSVCWEAILRGQLTYIVGSPWYKDLSVSNKYPNEQFSSISDFFDFISSTSRYQPAITCETDAISSWLKENLYFFPMHLDESDDCISETENSLAIMTHRVLNYTIENL